MIYLGINLKDNNKYIVIKVEQSTLLKPLLETEAFFIYCLKGLGIPEFLYLEELKILMF